jgi:RHS repeat-associated protein
MPEPITTTSYDANNRQLTFGDKTLSYDDNGNLQSITDSNGTTLYSWNARNQLVGISGPSVNASFVYDGLGRREAKTINGSLTEFLYDGLNPVQETAGATVLANILPGLGIDEFLTRTDVVAGVSSFFLTGALGSPVAVADNAGVVQTEYTYESFGRTTANGPLNSSSYQYTGRENDGTGLYYYRARYYHPALQRFISEDPIEFASGDVNFYAYVGGNPINYGDPTGEVAPLALALPYVVPALGALGKAAIYVGTAGLAGYLVHQATRVDSGAENLTPDQAAEKERERQAYHKRCDESPPAGLDPCAKAKWLLQRVIECIQMRVAWSQKWGIHHDDQIEERQREMERARRRVRQDCKCQK